MSLRPGREEADSGNDVPALKGLSENKTFITGARTRQLSVGMNGNRYWMDNC